MVGTNITVYTSHDMIESTFSHRGKKIRFYDTVYIVLARTVGSTLVTLEDQK